MIIIGLDDKEYDWKPRSSDCLDNKSALHNNVKKILREVFPFDIIMEEVELVGSRDWKGKKALTADFYIPNRKMIVEAHGEQHYSFNSFFYKNKLEFAKAKKRDSDKQEWCLKNNIEYVALSYKDKPTAWRNQIEHR